MPNDPSEHRPDPSVWWAIFDLMPEAATLSRQADGRLLAVNPAAAQMYGWPVEGMLGRSSLELGLYLEEADRERLVDLLGVTGLVREHQVRYRRRDGELRIGVFSGRRLEIGGEPCLLVIGRDVTEARNREQALRESEARYRMLAEATTDVPWQVDLEGRLLYVGPAVARLGYRPEGLLGRPVFALLHPDDLGTLRRGGRMGWRHGRRLRVRVRDARGRYRMFENNTAVVRDGEGRLLGVHGIARDVDRAVRRERRLLARAERDPLTGLLNRQGFLEAVRSTLDDPARMQAGVAFLFVDLDDFKCINDTAGHAAGDACLRAVSEALRAVLRASDRAGRIGGDEFAVLLTPITEADALGVGRRIVRLFEGLERDSPVGPLRITASIGLYMAQPGDRADRLLANADAAMYAAKGKGKNRVAVFRAPSGEQGRGARPRLISGYGRPGRARGRGPAPRPWPRARPAPRPRSSASRPPAGGCRRW